MAGTDSTEHPPTVDPPADTPPIDDEGGDTDMTAILDHPITDLAETSIPAGTPDNLDDVDAQIRGELEFLTSLIWAPDTAAAIHAIVGDHQHRATNRHPVDRIPLDHLHALFLHPPHAAVFAAVVELVDEGTPVSPAILGARAGMSDRQLRPTLLAIAAPTGHGPLPGGADVPYLARGIIDAYYRRGYAGLIARMNHALEEADTDDLAAHWAALTDHQQAAERRRLAITDQLAAL